MSRPDAMAVPTYTSEWCALVDAYDEFPHRFPELKQITLAQWARESEWGTSDLAKLHNNFAGLKYRRKMQKFATAVDYLAHDGPDIYCSFPNLQAFFNGYWRFLRREPYNGWRQHRNNPEAFITHLWKSGYTHHKEYVATVLDYRDLLSVVADDRAQNGTPK